MGLDGPLHLLSNLHADAESQPVAPRVQFSVLSALRPKERRKNILDVFATHANAFIDDSDFVHVGIFTTLVKR